MDRRIIRIFSILVLLPALQSCEWPIFSRPMFNLFFQKDVVGTWVAEFNQYDTLWMYSDRTFRHVVYDKYHTKAHDSWGNYKKFENPLWEDPYSSLNNYAEFTKKDYVYSDADTSWKSTLEYATIIHVGCGYEGKPRHKLYFVSEWWVPYWEMDNVEHFYYRKVE